MRTQTRIHRLAGVTAMLLLCGVRVNSQEPPALVTGPSADIQSDYRHLSLAVPRQQADGLRYVQFRYDLCSQRDRNLAFIWEDVGFGMDFPDPLPAGMCATYELSGGGYRLEEQTNLRFSAGSQRVRALLPCEGERGCTPQNPSLIGQATAQLTAYWRRRSGTVDKPTDVVAPLRVVVASSNAPGGRTIVRVDWAGPAIKFVGEFEDWKVDADRLRSEIVASGGGTFQFDTFPSLITKPSLVIPDVPHAGAFRVNPGEGVQSGSWYMELSPSAPRGRSLSLFILNEDNIPAARIDAPLPPRPQ